MRALHHFQQQAGVYKGWTPCVSHIIAVHAYCVCLVNRESLSAMADDLVLADSQAESSDREEEVEPSSKIQKHRGRGRLKQPIELSTQ